jgi:hypothetical protein
MFVIVVFVTSVVRRLRSISLCPPGENVYRAGSRPRLCGWISYCEEDRGLLWGICVSTLCRSERLSDTNRQVGDEVYVTCSRLADL